MSEVFQGSSIVLIEVDTNTKLLTVLENVVLKKQHTRSFYKLGNMDHFAECDNVVIGNTSDIIKQFVKNTL